MLNEAIAKIEEQQKALENSPAYWVGEQLKDMLQAEPWNADLVVHDLEIPEMAITEVEKKIAEEAKKNRKGNTGFCSPLQAEKIIREFYGFRPKPNDVPEQTAQPAQSPAEQPKKRKTISLEDFL